MPALADTTIRLLGQEPLAGRLPTAEQLRIAAILDRAGYAYLEVSGDLLIGTNGGIELPVRWFPKGEQEWAEQRLRPELRERLAELPVELVVVSHGDPVLENGADALRRALA